VGTMYRALARMVEAGLIEAARIGGLLPKAAK
jgi:hypothetical protein